MTEQLLSFSIGTTPILAPSGIPTGGLEAGYSIGSNLLTLIFIIAAILAFAFIIWGGLRWVMSGGDKTKVQNARNTLIYAIVGLIFIFLSFLIINIITYIFNMPSVTELPQ
jgi:hypothetical protein